ncbi:hypothetical protein [Bacillus horti]|uniref:Uncharacterized protein n=1 Tax=Caldalkalibacillus horti TaxID=77523 RepID=A0ABT9W0E8_9BACI|nr:hypothetical protein [Bacillus horti]
MNNVQEQGEFQKLTSTIGDMIDVSFYFSHSLLDMEHFLLKGRTN